MNPKIKISQLPAKGANLAAEDLLEIAEFTGTGYVSKSITGQEIIDAASGAGGVTDVTATAPLHSTGGTTPDISIAQASNVDEGYLSSADWISFNNKQDALISGTNIKTVNSTSLLGSGDVAVQAPITLTTTGTSGAATLVGATLNIPQYSGGGTNTLKFTSLQLTNGTSVTNSTTETITYSVLVPANTFTSQAFFDFTSRFTKTGSLGAWSSRIYKNTSNTLTGAILIGTIGNPHTNTQIYVQGVRFFRVSSSTIRYYQANFANVTDNLAANNNEGSTTFDLSVDNYFLVSVQLGSAVTDTIRGVFCKFLGYE